MASRNWLLPQLRNRHFAIDWALLMKQTIEAVRDAIAKECWLPALVLALTIPDILGQIAYPELINNRGNRIVGQQYRRWFHENVEHRFADHTGHDENWYARRPYFTADMCYKLRCELLHAGNDDIDFEYGDREDGLDCVYDFELRVNACNSYGSSLATPHDDERAIKHVHVCIDVKTLCDALCEGAERFMQNVSEDDLERHSVRIVDVAEFTRLNRGQEFI